MRQRTKESEAMNKTILGLTGFVALAALTASAVASAQETTYDFTGTVNYADGVYASAGPSLTGTITIDFGAANPSQSAGTIGSTNGRNWTAQVYGGPLFNNAPTPHALVFNETISAVGVSYGPSYPASYGVDNFVGCTFSCTTTSKVFPATWYATDNEFLSKNTYTTNYISLGGVTGGSNAPYDANGLPVLGNVGSQDDRLSATVNNIQVGVLTYTITSLTRVSAPEIDPVSAAGGLTLLLGGMAVLRGRGRVAAWKL
jgi:hypothetical protein